MREVLEEPAALPPLPRGSHTTARVPSPVQPKPHGTSVTQEVGVPGGGQLCPRFLPTQAAK